VEHFLRSGHYDTALELAKNSELVDLTNLEVFMVSREVETSLQQKNTSRCLTWCHDNKSKLRKMHSNLEFNLRIQEFIQLIKEDKRLDAVKHARKYFSTYENGQLQDVQRCMALLAFPIDTDLRPYSELLSESRWDELVIQFRQENFRLFQLANQSVFSVVLQAGLSALKTPQCYKSTGVRSSECPVCQEPLNTLAIPLPFAHCSQSRLVCSISGQPLNEHNPPMVLPNGHVFGEKSLRDMAAANDGKIVCPHTKEIFNYTSIDKVFVM